MEVAEAVEVVWAVVVEVVAVVVKGVEVVAVEVVVKGAEVVVGAVKDMAVKDMAVKDSIVGGGQGVIIDLSIIRHNMYRLVHTGVDAGMVY